MISNNYKYLKNGLANFSTDSPFLIFDDAGFWDANPTLPIG